MHFNQLGDEQFELIEIEPLAPLSVRLVSHSNNPFMGESPIREPYAGKPHVQFGGGSLEGMRDFLPLFNDSICDVAEGGGALTGYVRRVGLPVCQETEHRYGMEGFRKKQSNNIIYRTVKQ